MKEKQSVFSSSFILVVIGQIISLFGNAILRFALPLHLLNITKSPALFGVISAVSFIPIILCTPVGGIFADRINKRNIMVTLDLTVAILMLLFCILSGHINMIILLSGSMLILYGIAGAYQPSVQASIPLLVKEEGVVAANGIISSISSLSSLIGPVIGGICYSMAGLKPIILISIFCFFASAIMELFIKMDSPSLPIEGNVIKTVLLDMKNTLQYVSKNGPFVIRIISLCALFNCFITSYIIIALPTIITQYLGFQPSVASRFLGYNEAAMACGGLLGGILSNKLSKYIRMEKIHNILIYSACVLLPMGLTYSLHLNPYLCYAITLFCCFTLMFLASVFSIICISYIQVNMPSNMIGKIISCCIAVCQCAQPIGQTFYGILLEIFLQQIGIVTIFVGIVTIVISLIASRGIRQSWQIHCYQAEQN